MNNLSARGNILTCHRQDFAIIRTGICKRIIVPHYRFLLFLLINFFRQYILLEEIRQGKGIYSDEGKYATNLSALFVAVEKTEIKHICTYLRIHASLSFYKPPVTSLCLSHATPLLFQKSFLTCPFFLPPLVTCSNVRCYSPKVGPSHHFISLLTSHFSCYFSYFLFDFFLSIIQFVQFSH